MSHWIKLHDSILENEIWQDDQIAWHIFEFLLIKSYKGTPQGTTSTTRYKIEKALSVNNNTVYSALNRLKKAKMITISSTSRSTTISICNWSKYQLDHQPNEQRVSNQTSTKRQHSYKNKIKNKELDTTVSMSTHIDVKQLFYQLVTGLGFSEQVRFTDERRRKLTSRLRIYTAANMLAAARAIHDDAYLQGDNDRGKRYGDIDYLLRNDQIVDRFLQLGNGSDIDVTKLEIKL